MAQNTTLKGNINNQYIELHAKTGVDQVVLEDNATRLNAKLAEMVAAINTKQTRTEVQTLINIAINDLIGGAPSTADTLKELADLIAANKTVADALVAALANKVTKEDGKGLSTNDFTNALKKKLEDIDLDNLGTGGGGTSNYDPPNKDVLDTLTSAMLASWNAKSKIYYAEREPLGMLKQDLWFQPVEPDQSPGDLPSPNTIDWANITNKPSILTRQQVTDLVTANTQNKAELVLDDGSGVTTPLTGMTFKEVATPTGSPFGESKVLRGVVEANQTMTMSFAGGSEHYMGFMSTVCDDLSGAGYPNTFVAYLYGLGRASNGAYTTLYKDTSAANVTSYANGEYNFATGHRYAYTIVLTYGDLPTITVT